MLDTLQAWDEALLLALNGQPSWLRDVAWIVTSKWCFVPAILMMIVGLYRMADSRKAWIGFVAALLTFAGTDAVSSRLMKPGFERLRPSHNERLSDQLKLHAFQNGTFYRGGTYGFVSSHAANSFGLATFAVLLFGARIWRWLWIWAAIVSWSRIYLGVHYPGDILFGALFGAGWACACYNLMNRISTSTPST